MLPSLVAEVSRVGGSAHSVPQVEDVCVFSRNDFLTVSNGQLNADLTTASLYNVLILEGIKCTVAFELLLLDAFACRGTYWPAVHHSKVSSASKSFSKILILLLLLVTGNMSTNPGPDLLPESLHQLPTPLEFSNRHGLGFLHINARSLVPKLDIFKTWFMISKPDVVVVSETWLKPSVSDNVLFIDGYRIFRSDRKGRAGGVAVYIVLLHVLGVQNYPNPKVGLFSDLGSGISRSKLSFKIYPE